MLSVTSSSRVGLAAGVRLQGTTICDEPTGSTHLLNPSAADALAELTSGDTFERACATLAGRWSARDEQVREDLAALLDQLDRFDLIEVRGGRGLKDVARSAARYMRSPALSALSLWTWLLGSPARAAGRRHPATIVGVARATARSQAVALAVLVVVLPLLAVGVQAGLDEGHPGRSLTGAGGLFAHLCVAGAAFFSLTVLHELAHLHAVRLVGGTVQYVHSRGWCVSVVHGPLQPARNAAVAMAGPVLAFGAGLSVALALHRRAHQGLGLQTSYAAMILAAACAQLISLAPWAEDGRSLFRVPRPASPARRAGEGR